MTESDYQSQPAGPTGAGDPLPGTPPDYSILTPAFEKLCDVIARLRSPEGCPWDREQTLETIKPYTLEETYELLEAIDSGNDEHIIEELGDLLLQIVLDAQIAADEGRFDLTHVVDRLTQKMIERHPHVFGDVAAETPDEVRRNWDQIKEQEKQRRSIFDGLPAALPALARASRVAEKAAKVGYDFPHRDMLFDKLREEIQELADEIFPDGQIPHTPATVEAEIVADTELADPELRERVEGELGDILFVVANIARRWKINPEEALRKSNSKFQERVQKIEQELERTGGSIQEASLQEMEQIYQAVKLQEKRDV
ncbi:nucleoside triphosphate pyrophosphohydrolase [Gimesia maris]|uniref:Nucleoside triphosphate pyrophosphohydrolase n=1 Tax=Gimesia maris TaxID=122 RepID=A0A3D3R2R8_9PLAN|nr:nucleoside triphosphate pyrophosphohydrolase [Gimesia sp.]HCO23161.1 nucleoside triphosphate pyrophosphohydrolase [Gimesia maris]|tara:strand:- start:37887 stop:38825 length:939 start_codon:yes stop_codon:yes gene_type:complete